SVAGLRTHLPPAARYRTVTACESSQLPVVAMSVPPKVAPSGPWPRLPGHGRIARVRSPPSPVAAWSARSLSSDIDIPNTRRHDTVSATHRAVGPLETPRTVSGHW